MLQNKRQENAIYLNLYATTMIIEFCLNSTLHALFPPLQEGKVHSMLSTILISVLFKSTPLNSIVLHLFFYKQHHFINIDRVQEYIPFQQGFWLLAG